MATRAIYTFIDEDDSYDVYKHWDGNPKGAATFIERAKTKAWPGARFEASEYAAAFVAANKNKGGDVHLVKHRSRHSDIEYRYEITQGLAEVNVKCFWTDLGRRPEQMVYDGPLSGLESCDKHPR